MSRIRLVNEKAVANTLAFLNDLKLKCEGIDYQNMSYTELHNLNHVSKSTFSICKKLNFIGSRGQWLIGNPQRENAIQILEILRQRVSKRVDVPLSADFALAIDKLITKLDIISVQHENSLNRLKTPLLNKALQQSDMSHNNLFSQVESKEQKRFELAKAIASGVFKNFEDLNNHSSINIRIINAADDLLNKLNSKP